MLEVIQEMVDVWARHSYSPGGLLGIQVDDASFERLRAELLSIALVSQRTALVGRCVQVNTPVGSVLVFAPFCGGE